MAKKIAFIGAGSFGFTRGLVRDLLTFPAFQDATLALMDIDEERLAFTKKAVERIIRKGKYRAKIEVTGDRVAALQGADGVVITILQGGPQVFRTDIEIPKKYGIDINVGDTRGPSGIFRTLRTLPVMLDICADIARCCPEAIVLNYTNPMAMLCRGMQASYPQLRITGLCHSVQGTAEMLARWIGAPMSEITFLCAGINHQAFYLEYKRNGQDAYPQIRAAVTGNPEIARAEQVRNEMYLHLDYYPTESSGHNSEYNAWFRKRPDLIETYCTHGTNWNPGHYGYILQEYLRREHDWRDLIKAELRKEIDLQRGHEYAATIFNAVFGDRTLFEFNGNVRNWGLIDNLPAGCCVEVPVVASAAGLRAMHVGALPPQLALLNTISASCEELAVDGALAGDEHKIFHACLYDPLASAVLSMSEIQAMVTEMLEANRVHLGHFACFKGSRRRRAKG